MSETKDAKPAETQNSEPHIPFEDEKGMYGTSPVTKELTDGDVEHLTSKTMPRVRLSRSKRKITLYISLFMIAWFVLQLIYHRTAPVTGFVVNPVFGLGEMGLVIVCSLMTIANWFLIAPEDEHIKTAIRFIGVGIPAIFLIALYALPAETIFSLTQFLFK